MRRSLDVYETLDDAPAWVGERIERIKMARDTVKNGAFIIVIRVGHKVDALDFDFIRALADRRTWTVLRGENNEMQTVYLIGSRVES